MASLSVALEIAEKIRLPRSLYSFTLPLGAQLNKDGTSVMLGAVLLFTAQAAGVGFGAASFLAILFVGLLEVAAIVGGIYRLVDMGNTTLNVMGDMVATGLLAHSEARREGKFREAQS